MKRILSKLKLDRYFSSKLVLAIDMAVSMMASTVALLLVSLDPNTELTRQTVVVWLAGALAASCVMFYLLRTYRSIIRHSTLREVGKLCIAVFGKTFVLCVVLHACERNPMPYVVSVALPVLDFLVSVCALVLIRVAMIVTYDMLMRRLNAERRFKRILIYGTGDKSVAVVTRLQKSPHYKIAGFLTYGKTPDGHTLSELPVLYFDNLNRVDRIRAAYDIDAVLFAMYDDARMEQNRLLKHCSDCGLKVLFAPPIDEVVAGKLIRASIREIKIEDLLGREEIKISMDEIKTNFRDKTILVTGAAGSIGSQLCRQLAKFGIRKLVMFDNAETPMHNIRLELEENCPELDFTPVVGDVRSEQRLQFVFSKYRPQVVFHAAAYKHVPLMEENPCEAVMVNVVGTRNVADKCIEYNVEKMVMISTDKAVNPTNVMGCTKRLAEIYVQSLGLAIEHGAVEGKTKFVTTRFGNVLGSNGSVIPRFREQIAKGGPVTVTHPEITRFFMTIPEACRLVMEAATISTGNQICVFDMGESVRIADLARRMIEMAGFQVGKDIEIEYTGLRPGEKLYEEVLSNRENTIPTSHEMIRIAKVREYDYAEACRAMDMLNDYACRVIIPDMIRLMKATVPEFKSQNSKHMVYDSDPASGSEHVVADEATV